MAIDIAEQIRAGLAADFPRYTLDIRVSARRKRTAQIRVEPDGRTIVLMVPAAVDADRIIRWVKAQREAIAGHAKKARENAPEDTARQLVDGADFRWLGRHARLRLIDGYGRVRMDHTDSGLWLLAPRREIAARGARPIIEWYVREGTDFIQTRVPDWWPRMAGTKQVKQVRVADIGRRRWGVYRTQQHHVDIAWQTMQLPRSLVDHVLVHELTHATKPGGKSHGPEFWRAFERVIPLARAEGKRLNDEVGRTVWHGDVRPS